jgi:phosphoesterase RecJ-like protein
VKKKKISEIIDIIKTRSDFLVTSHQDSDGDSLGSQLALGELLSSWGKRFKIVNQGEIASKYRFLDKRALIQTSEAALAFQPEVVFVLECPDLSRVGSVQKMIPEDALLINIDHHQDNSGFGDINWVDLKASAVGEMIYDLLISAGHHLSPDAAEQIYAAILTDTGRFRFRGTTPRSLNICAKLLRLGVDPETVTERIYFSHGEANLRLLGDLIRRMEVFFGGRACVLSLSNGDLERFNASFADTEGFVDYTQYLEGVEVGILFKEIAPGVTKASMRSNDAFNLIPFVKNFGGGGHKGAAGCTIYKPLEEAKRLILGHLKKCFDRGT